MDLKLARQICRFTIELMFHSDIEALSPKRDNPTFIQYSSFVLSIITLVLGLVGNTIVIIITGFVMKTNKCRIWFLNLAIADLMFLLVLPLNAISVLRANWPYGEHVCKMYYFLSIVNMYASIFIITALTFDRFLSVMAPIWHHMFYSPRVSFCTCASIWAVTVLASIPVIVHSYVPEFGGQTMCSLYYSDVNKFAFVGGIASNLSGISEKIKTFSPEHRNEMEQKFFADCVDHFDHKYREKNYRLSLITNTFLIPVLILGYFIPVCVIICCNVAIACKVRTFETIRSSKLFCIICAAIMLFFITRTPLVVSQIILLVCFHTMDLTLITKIVLVSPLLSSIANLNCCLNPVIYVFFGKEVMSVFMNFLRRSRQRNSNPPSSHPLDRSLQSQ